MVMATQVRAFRIYTTTMALVSVATAGYLAVRYGLPALGPTLLFCSLTVYSEHRSVEFAEGAAMNAGFIVLMAAIVAFHGTSAALLGPLLVGMSKGIYVPHIRAHSWSLIAWNVASGLALLASAATLELFPESVSAHMPGALLAAVPISLVSAIGICLILGPGFIMRGQQLRLLIGEFAPRTLESVPFSVVGFFIGRLYLGIGAAAVLMLIVPMFIAREMFASYLRVKESHDETVGMLIHALEAKDRYTSGHSERVADYARYIGEELKFMPARLERLRFAALMHDIGKLVVPNQLLNKPGRLTPEEFSQVRVHEKVSVQMLSHIDFLRPIAAASHSDATRFDPDDPDHPIEPYIVMIADAYDAMTSTRAYRKALPQDVAFQELRDNAGAQFHPACVEALIHAVEKRGEQHGAGYEVHAEFEDAPVVGVGSAGLGDLLDNASERSSTPAS
jgi:HD-GYP domain-containing protein (c-di-GMP phosphodiesterase class II)